ncbi:hypothetical protein SARC_05281 [Sphaeroforma arctica JP610]|uniref:NADH:ubiquinone oxidoreductase intermediate-associated protein 30 domain-containing protein n=1 Tax=Sphaeroforma arctica JP610 TaxID=667725 RepID=A0A0L0G0R8_9EUKA|nr:hypothetical protein SARC_05281 [Sphaeroforma arctica JP610]KNC82431.1 hypothetical protein SARC_05281 [Sphaeroforma arctica JP610]|eukprot:XP_014156333.1 hypothetical protein SARC_05281 [Sphaeroforma arctica JP610]
MGQAVRMVRYHYNGDTQYPIDVLNFANTKLVWKTLDDGVMGGQSNTCLSHTSERHLCFEGVINTSGGGFASARAVLPELSEQALNSDNESTKIDYIDKHSIKIRCKGDGKTFKLIMSAGNAGGPFARNPSWQADITTNRVIEHDDENSVNKPTAMLTTLDGRSITRDGDITDENIGDKVVDTNTDEDDWDEQMIPFTAFMPTWGGKPSSRPPAEEKTKHTFDIMQMREIGIMLSLKLSDGSPNPKETFGEGVFPFSHMFSRFH